MPVTRTTLRLSSRLRRTIGAEADDADRELTRAWVREWDQLTPGWATAAADLAAEAARLEHWPRPTDLARLGSVMGVLQATEAALDRLVDLLVTVAAPAASRAIDATVALEPRVLASQAPAAQQEALLAHLTREQDEDQTTVWATVVARIRTDTIEQIRARVEQQIASTARPLSDEAMEAVRRQLIAGVDLGLNPREVAQRMVDSVEGAFNGGLSRALVISRTEILDAYRRTSQQIHTANSDLVKGWQWQAQLDRRCCPSCWAMHGTVHRVDEPGPLDHQQGRCARLPVLATWQELGFDVPEPPSELPDAQQTFRSLPEADQLAIMGPARWELLRSGRITWSDLATRRENPRWRASYVPTTVAELRRIAVERPPGTPSGDMAAVYRAITSRS